MFQHIRRALALPLIIAVAACAGDAADEQAEETSSADSVRAITTEPEIQSPALSAGSTATAVLAPTEGNDAEGLVWFGPTDENGGGVRIEADIDNVAAGPHGFHIHENGDCSAPDASSAGGHFAPNGNPHGAPSDPAGERHVGDLGNIDANPEGYAEYDWIDPLVQLEGPDSVIGRAVVLHEMPDDLESQPSGAAGPPIACGVIEAVSAEDM